MDSLSPASAGGYEVFVTVWLEPGSPPIRTSLEACLLPLTAAIQGGGNHDGAPAAAPLKIRLDGVLRTGVSTVAAGQTGPAPRERGPKRG